MGWRRVGVAPPPVFPHPSSSLLHSTFTCYFVVMPLIFVFSEGGRRSLDAQRGKMIFRATWWARLWGESVLRTMCFTRSQALHGGLQGPQGTSGESTGRPVCCPGFRGGSVTRVRPGQVAESFQPFAPACVPTPICPDDKAVSCSSSCCPCPLPETPCHCHGGRITRQPLLSVAKGAL